MCFPHEWYGIQREKRKVRDLDLLSMEADPLRMLCETLLRESGRGLINLAASSNIIACSGQRPVELQSRSKISMPKIPLCTTTWHVPVGARDRVVQRSNKLLSRAQDRNHEILSFSCPARFGSERHYRSHLFWDDSHAASSLR